MPSLVSRSPVAKRCRVVINPAHEGKASSARAGHRMQWRVSKRAGIKKHGIIDGGVR